MNVTMLLDMAADVFGDRIVVGRRRDGLTAERLRALAAGGAGLVRSRGADSLIYLAVNGPAFPVALFAAARAGVPLVPVNYRLGAEQLTALLARHPRAHVVADPAQHAIVEQSGLAAQTPAEWLDAAAGPAADDVEEFVDPDSAAVIIYTSGTTSAPKGVVLRHQNLVSYVLGTVEFAGADADDAALMSVPPYHIAAVSNALTNLFAGRRTMVLEAFTPQGWLELVRDQGVTNAMVVPTMLTRLMDADGLDRSVPSLRSLAYGGASMPARVIERALEEWPHVGFVNAYGLTETSSTITVLGPDEHRAALSSDLDHVQARLSSAGRAVPGIEIEIRDEHGGRVGPGVAGQIWVRGDQVSTEYTGKGSTVDPDGWFYTRDEGRLDEDGYLFVGGRVDDTIIRGAENIAPAEIENVLLRHPDVADAVVVGVPDEEWGQRIEAVVVARPGSAPDLEELRSGVRGALRGSKTPERIECWPELPRTPTGKLVRRDVVAGLEVPSRTPSNT
ncbi:class I adenylate-forming enzyme family protein [Pseudonocardia sp.]|jgi:acyl-CoA synthetase (AMP-forming)/AMP-acid ligase II|uniref:class I adenylate-forming enzyme family protein n=1 Tax=Pseudonocardia sp. TaxID=60912 RepID=UPI002616AABC|nr:class I adenylate-forming enzyme family protein [Pseudonocardia sp.]MCW2717872.1 AMP-dependent acyl-CoA synthetase/AMP-acid ligase [Pseudonocardia sp.]